MSFTFVKSLVGVRSPTRISFFPEGNCLFDLNAKVGYHEFFSLPNTDMVEWTCDNSINVRTIVVILPAIGLSGKFATRVWIQRLRFSKIQKKGGLIGLAIHKRPLKRCTKIYISFLFGASLLVKLGYRLHLYHRSPTDLR
jgi:hypothetical protein